jgi:AraC-like DNA-binding protein
MEFSFHLHHYEKVLEQFAQQFQQNLRNGFIQLSSDIGSGYIEAGSVGDQISYIVQNFSLNDHLSFKRLPTAEKNISIFFNQIRVNQVFEIQTDQGIIQDTQAVRSNIFLSTTDTHLEVKYTPGTVLQRVGICLHESLLNKYVREHLRLNLELYTHNLLDNVNQELITSSYLPLLEDIFLHSGQYPLGKLMQQNRILLLLETFFQNFLEKMEQEGIPGKKVAGRDFASLQEIEKILSDTSLQKFPSIPELSKLALMSASKLKTAFRNAYGMKLYEFYNWKRLNKAKEMIESGDFSVKEAGYEIGYTNLSNFSRAFFKAFGVLPSAFKQVKK